MQEGNWIDTVIYLMLVLSAVWGLWRGLFSSLFGIIALVFAIIIARDFSPLLEPSLFPIFGQSPLLPVVSTFLVFLIAFLLLGLFARLIAATLHQYDIGGLNLLGGVAFGVLRGGIFAVLFVLLLSMIGVHQTAAWKEAKTVPLVGIALHATMQAPFAVSYRQWVHFDKRGRPVVRDVTRAKARKNKNKKESESEVESDADLIEKLRPTRDKEYEQVMNELGNFVAIRSARTPPKEQVYHGDDDSEQTGFKKLLERLLCTLGGEKDCQSAQ